MWDDEDTLMFCIYILHTLSGLSVGFDEWSDSVFVFCYMICKQDNTKYCSTFRWSSVINSSHKLMKNENWWCLCFQMVNFNWSKIVIIIILNDAHNSQHFFSRFCNSRKLFEVGSSSYSQKKKKKKIKTNHTHTNDRMNIIDALYSSFYGGQIFIGAKWS